MNFDFDKLPNRRGTMSVKWDSDPDPEMLPLWVADMDFTTAPCIIEALERRVAHGVFGYTHPGKEYYDAVTGWFDRRHGWKFDSSQVIYTIGVVPAISACIKALTNPGDGVIIMTPVYTCFFSSIRNNGCRVVESPLKRTETSYAIDFDSLEDLCRDSTNKILLLCNPHNPAGRVWTHDELRRVNDICVAHGVTVISDEIHCEIVFKPHAYVPYATVATGPYVICCSASKAFNTAGLQCANIVSPDEKMRALIDRAININETCDVGPMGVTAVIAAYNDGEEWLDACVQYIHGNYELLKERLGAMPGNLKVLDLEGTYLAWVDVSSLDIPSAWLCDALMREAHIWFTPGTEYGWAGEGYLRINLATSRAILTEALDRLQSWLQNR